MAWDIERAVGVDVDEAGSLFVADKGAGMVGQTLFQTLNIPRDSLSLTSLCPNHQFTP